MDIFKSSHLFIQILFFTADDSCADVFCIVAHEQNLEKRRYVMVWKFFFI